jgi:hypothetical protein
MNIAYLRMILTTILMGALGFVIYAGDLEAVAVTVFAVVVVGIVVVEITVIHQLLVGLQQMLQQLGQMIYNQTEEGKQAKLQQIQKQMADAQKEAKIIDPNGAKND